MPSRCECGMPGRLRVFGDYIGTLRLNHICASDATQMTLPLRLDAANALAEASRDLLLAADAYRAQAKAAHPMIANVLNDAIGRAQQTLAGYDAARKETPDG